MVARSSVWFGRTRAAALLMLAACQGSAPTSSGPATSAAPSTAAGVPATPSSKAVAAPPTATPTGHVPSGSPLPASTSSTSSTTRAAAPVAAPACRVVTLSGAATKEGQPLRVGDAFGGTPIELATGARLHFVHVSSARAWSLEGPARLAACAGGAEEIVLGRGTLRAEPGSGVRPGAEVWVGTPFGALRYADAAASMNVGERQLSVRVATGRVWFTPLGGDSLDERPIATEATFSAAPYRLSGARSLERCSRDASAAEERARSLLAPSTRPLGERAAEHVRARQRARASCVSARAVALATPSPDPSTGAELARYDALWRGVPERAAARQP